MIGFHLPPIKVIVAVTVQWVFSTLFSADSIGKFSGEAFLENGIFFPADNGKVPFILRTDSGETAAVVLTSPGHEYKTYAITGNNAYSFEDIADFLTNIICAY